MLIELTVAEKRRNQISQIENYLRQALEMDTASQQSTDRNKRPADASNDIRVTADTDTRYDLRTANDPLMTQQLASQVSTLQQPRGPLTTLPREPLTEQPAANNTPTLLTVLTNYTRQINGLTKKIQQAIDRGDTATLALLLNSAGNVLSALKPDEQGYDIHPKASSVDAQVNTANPNLSSWAAVLGWAGNSSTQWQDTASVINDMSNTYQKAFAQASMIYTQFFNDYANKILQKVEDGQRIDLPNGNQKISWDEDLPDTFRSFKDSWRDNMTRDRVFWPTQTESSNAMRTGTKADAQRWASALGLDSQLNILPLHGAENDNNGWVVTVDTQPLENIVNQWPASQFNQEPGSGKLSLSAAQYNALQQLVTVSGQQINQLAQHLVQKQPETNHPANNMLSLLAASLAESLESAQRALQSK